MEIGEWMGEGREGGEPDVEVGLMYLVLLNIERDGVMT